MASPKKRMSVTVGDNHWILTITQNPERRTAGTSAELEGSNMDYKEVREQFRRDGLEATLLNLGMSRPEVLSDMIPVPGKPLIVVSTKFPPNMDYVETMAALLQHKHQAETLPMDTPTSQRTV